jgi:chromosome partitioning protein
LYTIVMASQKGGSGKTTLSGHLAVEADRAGAGPVVLIDTDPQGSLSHWWNSRSMETPQFVKAGLFELGDALEQLRQAGVKLVFIDTPPAITTSISQVVGHADLVVVPTRPSPHDLRAVGATVDIAERHQKPVIFVLNAATARARITGEAAVALSQHGTVAPVTIHHRVDFAASMVDGRTVGEVMPRSASAKEVTELWTYMQFRLSRLMRDPQMLPQFMPRDQALAPLLSALEDESSPETNGAYGAEEFTPEAEIPEPVVHRTAMPRHAVPRQVAPAAAPQAAAPHVVVAPAAKPQMEAPQVVVAPPAARQVAAPQAAAPQQVMPQPVVQQTVVPQPVAPQVVAPPAAVEQTVVPPVAMPPVVMPQMAEPQTADVAIVEDVQTAEPPPFYTGPDRRVNPPGTPYFGVERRAAPAGTFGRRSTLSYHNEETGGRK